MYKINHRPNFLVHTCWCILSWLCELRIQIQIYLNSRPIFYPNSKEFKTRKRKRKKKGGGARPTGRPGRPASPAPRLLSPPGPAQPAPRPRSSRLGPGPTGRRARPPSTWAERPAQGRASLPSPRLADRRTPRVRTVSHLPPEISRAFLPPLGHVRARAFRVESASRSFP